MSAKRKLTLSGLTGLVTLSIFLAACQPGPAVAPTASSVPTEAPAPTATPVPPRTLVVCLGQEPQTLYPYGGASHAMWSVLEAVYDGPIDRTDYGYQPVILEDIPSLENGGARVQSVYVSSGEEVVDADGNLVALARGTRVKPSGCSGPDCQVIWDGASPLKMDQVLATYVLRDGLKWSDGEPLTAEDSVYSFTLASDSVTPGSKVRVDRTVSYKALDELTVEWLGVPGYLGSNLATDFWMPLPQHAWEGISPADLLTADESSRSPIGWGPYILEEWVQGQYIRLHKNPNYFRAGEGLPKFDFVEYRFMGEQGDNNVEALLTGECDVVDQSARLEDKLETILDLQKNNKVQALIGLGPEVEVLDFGIRPASYDDGYNPWAGDRPDFFGDVRMRQAVAACLDRQTAIDKQLLGQSPIPNSYLPPVHPLAMKELPVAAYNPQEGARLLDEIGWKDTDGDPATPREASGVANINDGTQLVLNYVTTQAYLRQEVAKRLANSLAGCGIQVNVQYLNPADLFAAGENGPLFGRKFDLAQFSWQAGDEPPCFLYESAQIPARENHWLGVNITGYSSPAYDAACSTARQSLPGSAEYTARHQEAQTILAQDLPFIPLYDQVQVLGARPDLCGLSFDPSARSEFWNLEQLDYGAGCKK